jgi:protein SCO1/2
MFKYSKLINIILVVLFIVSCKGTKNKETKLLPVFGEKKAVGNEEGDTIYHIVKPFLFINQYNEKVTEETVKGKIYVADFFFATCESICPKMSTQLITVQNAFAKDDSVLILSHTVNPMHDTVEVLKKYAERFGATKNKWHLLTGNKKEIYDMARYSYLVNALEDDGSAEGFLHSELFVLIDSKKRIRGFYDGTDNVAVAKLIADIKLLKTE